MSLISRTFCSIPFSAYQVIVLKVAEGIEELPGDYGFRLKSASDAKKEDLNFYIAAEQENAPVIDKPWKFTVGDGEKTANYINGRLESGENYIVYERALTKTENVSIPVILIDVTPFLYWERADF